jgi:IS5 family transposase
MFQNSIMSAWFSAIKKDIKSAKFLKEMNKIIPYKELEKEIREKYEKNNKRWSKQYPLELMMKVYFLQNFYSLWDEALEEAIYDRLSFQEYLWIDILWNNVPDATTIENFRHFLETNNLQEKLFERVVDMLVWKWIILKRGTIVDATIIRTSSSTKNKEKKRDKEMGSTKKNNNYYFWGKVHIWVDTDSGLVHRVKTTKASESDIWQTEALLHWEERAIFWDKAYSNKERKKECRKKWIYYWIKDRWAKNLKLSKRQEKRNRKKATQRAIWEHPFRVLKCQFWFKKFSYKWILKNSLAILTKFALINLYMARKVLLQLITS